MRGQEPRKHTEVAKVRSPEIEAIVSTHAPHLLEVNGVRAVVASQLLVTVGDNPERLASEAAFAALTGTAPVPASSGKIIRHRLSRGGDRAANSAVHRIVLVGMSKDQRTRDYVARGTEEGKDELEIMRCLKRYVSREIYRVRRNPRPAPVVNDLRPRRQALGYTQVAVAQQLATWPTAISRVERCKSRDLDLINPYRQWLDDQPKISS